MAAGVTEFWMAFALVTGQAFLFGSIYFGFNELVNV